MSQVVVDEKEIVEFLSFLRQLDVHLSADNQRLSCTAPKGVLTEELKGQIQEKKCQILDFLAQHQSAGPSLAISRVIRGGSLQTSFAQERLWFLEQFEGKSSAYNIAAGIRLTGALNREAIEKSIKEIIVRHEVLRTNIVNVDGNPRVEIRSAAEWKMECQSFLGDSNAEERLLQFARTELARPFDLASELLIRAYLIEMGRDDHALLFNLHHIAADGWSLGVIAQELTKLYIAYSESKPNPLPELPLQYLDYAHWHRQHVARVMHTQLPFWRHQLRAPLPTTELPTDYHRPSMLTYRGRRLRQTLSPQILAAAQRFVTDESITLFILLLTVFKILLFRYTNQPDVLVGTASAGRTHPEFEQLIGLFINNLPLRTDLSGDPTAREVIASVKENTLNAFSRQDVPFGTLVEAARSQRNLDRSPLFQVMFILQNFRVQTLQLAGLTLTPIEFDIGTSRFDLTIEAGEKDQGLCLHWEYNSDLFAESTVLNLQRHYQALLENVLRQPERHISDLEILTEEDHQALNEIAVGGSFEYPKNLCVHQLFEQQAARHSESLAVIFGEERLTYRELNARANRLAHRLRALGIGTNLLVGLCLERSADIAVATLAVLKSGGAYVPIDPQYPKDRVRFMLQDSGAKVLITEEHLLESLSISGLAVICLDRDRQVLMLQPETEVTPGAQPENLAYVIYTSGSTGTPKGVEVTHRSVVNFLCSMQREPGISPQDRLLAVTTLSFDIAGLEIYLPLVTGACVVIAPRASLSDGAALAQMLEEFDITIMQATPVTWRLLLDSGWQGKRGLRILCGGEALTRETANRLLATGCEVWNLYGPTETTIWSTIHRVDNRKGSVPIGKPISNTKLHVLDANRRPVPFGVSGELYIGGDGLASGYLRRPELTSERFVADPNRPSERLYRTGDQVRWLRDGNLDYIARLDHQVKLRGFRIELGEIESVLEQQPEVRQSVVLVREDAPGDQRLTAYIVPRKPSTIDAKTLRDVLLSRLPEYMTPSQFVFLESFPLTPNNKVDRKALPPPTNGAAPSALYAPPRTETEIQVAALWQDILKNGRVGINDNFFDLGGHSLLVVQLQSRLRNTLRREVSLVDLFQKPTVAALAGFLDASGQVTVGPAPAPSSPG